MIRRFRCRVPFVLSGMLLVAGLALANEPVTRSQMHEFVYQTIAAAAVLVIGAFWVLLTTVNSKSERSLLAIVTRLEAAVQRAVDALETHNGNPHAHTAASEHNHAPLLEQIEAISSQAERIKNTVDQVLRDCEAIRCRARDPKDSPRLRRSTDPEGFDAAEADVRGKR